MIRTLFSWLLRRPPTPRIERDGRGLFYKVGPRGRKLRFDPRDTKHAAIARLIAMTGGIFPPKGAGVARRVEFFAMHDKATDTVYALEATRESYLRTLDRIRADRAELLRVEPSDPAAIQWDSP